MKAYGHVYLINCLPSGKSYVGITKQSVKRRWNAHVLRARLGESGCPALAAAIRKYGPEAFVVSALACARSLEDLCETERRLIGQLRTQSPNGYNLGAGGEGLRDPSPETRARMRASHLGVKQNPDLIERRIAPLRGRKRSREAVEKARRTQTGQKRSPETCANVKASRVGLFTPEVRARMSAAHKGVLFSEERKARLKGRKQSVESNAKRSASLKGDARTPERERLILQMWPTLVPTHEIRKYVNAMPGPSLSTKALAQLAFCLGVRRISKKGEARTPERETLIRTLWPSSARKQEIVHRVNLLPGPHISCRAIGMIAFHLGIKRRKGAWKWAPGRNDIKHSPETKAKIGTASAARAKKPAYADPRQGSLF